MSIVYPDNTLVIAGFGNGRSTGLGRIHKSGNLTPGCFGYWVISQTGDPGHDWDLPRFTQHVTPAVVGDTVCRHPRCFCGLAHVTVEQFGWLPLKGEEPWRVRVVEGSDSPVVNRD